MYNAIDIAQWFLDKGKENNIEFNVHKLNKIVVLAHFWYIGYHNKPLVIVVLLFHSSLLESIIES